MKIIGRDFHLRFQQIAVDTETGSKMERMGNVGQSIGVLSRIG